MTTLAEDLAFLLVDAESGRIVTDTAALDRGIAGALLLDLALRERLAVDGAGRRQRLYAAGAAPTGEPVLDAALARLGTTRSPAQRAVQRLTGGSRESVFDRLVRRGLVERVRRRAAGLFPTTRWRVLDPANHRHLRERLARVLLHDQPPDVRMACLISLLHAVRAVHRVVDGPARRARARAAEIARGELIGSAVRSSVDGVRNVVVMAAFAAATGAATQHPLT